MNNKAFWRAYRSLCHPLSCLAIIALLLNDHWLRYQMPSWWTGKLGDFTWLVFAPFIAALVIAWLIPRKHPKQERIVSLIAFSAIGIWFALAKTVPAVHALTTSTLDAIVGWRGGLRMDATDLITLPALWIGWRIWQRVSSTTPILSLGWVAFALGMLGTLATSCAPANYGIALLCQNENSLLAFTNAGYGYAAFQSLDGGLTWNAVKNQTPPNACIERFSSWPVVSTQTLTDGRRQYRLVPGEAIYLSMNNQPETNVFDLSLYQHDSYKLLHEGASSSTFLCGGPRIYKVGPLDALIDQQSGNLILAMGLDGILLKSPDSDWQWVAVGSYHHADLENLDGLFQTLRPEFFLTIALILLTLPTIAMSESLRWYSATYLTILWLIWLGAVLIRQSNGWLIANSDILLMIAAVPLAWTAFHYIVQRRQAGAVLMLIVISVSTGLLFLLPYLLWIRRTLPNYGMAKLFALLLGGTALYMAWLYFRLRFPARKKKKHDDEKPKHDVYSIDTSV